MRILHPAWRGEGVVSDDVELLHRITGSKRSMKLCRGIPERIPKPRPSQVYKLTIQPSRAGEGEQNDEGRRINASRENRIKCRLYTKLWIIFTYNNSCFGVPEWGRRFFTKSYMGLTLHLSFDIISIISNDK